MTKVQIKTSKGDMTLELYDAEAPKTVANFLSYVDSGFYKDTIFHRVIDNFMVQGGGFTADFVQKDTNEPVENEAMNGLQNKRGTIAMARTQVVDSATSQFFINVCDNDFLNFRAPTPAAFGYCVFGKVIEGEEVLDLIRKVKTTSRGYYDDVPVENVMIYDVVRL